MLGEQQIIYLDNASTSYPKPEEVSESLAHFYDQPIGSYGRSGDLHTIEVSGIIEELRDLLAERIGANDMGSHIIFTPNATDGINRVLSGLPSLSENEVAISPLEHNSVTRPLYAKLNGKDPLLLPYMEDGTIHLEHMKEKITQWQKEVDLKLVILNQMSNVNGVTQPTAEVIKILRALSPACQILLDASQAFPYVSPLSRELLPDYLVLTGHKGSLGPTGTGALFILHPEALNPTVRGGNGYRSEEQESSPYMPDRFEAGTLNMMGLVAWHTALTHLGKPVISKELWLQHIRMVKALPGVKVYDALQPTAQGPLYSITSERYSPAELGDLLNRRYHISTRSGIHCAPMAHRTLKTLPEGTTRISISTLTPTSHIEVLYQALYELHRR